MPEVELTFKAELKQLRAELAKMPDIAGTEAIKTVKTLEKQWKRSEKAAKRAAKKIKDDSQRTTKGLQGLKNAAEGMGGAFGANAGSVEKFGQAATQLTAAVGPLGVALGASVLAGAAAAVAFVAVSAAIVSLIREADKMTAAVAEYDDAIGRAVDPEKVAALHRTADAMDAIGVVGERLTVIVGAELATELEDLFQMSLRLSLVFLDLNERFGLVSKSVTALGMALNFATLGASGLVVDGLELVDDATRDVSGATDDLVASVRAKKDADDKGKASTTGHAKASREQADAAKAAADAIKDAVAAVRAQIAAQESLVAIVATSEADLLGPMAKLNAEYSAREIQILDLAAAAGDFDAGQDALAANEARRIREISAIQDKAGADFMASVAVMADGLDDAGLSMGAAVQIWAAETGAALDNLNSAASSITDSMLTFSTLRIEALQAEAATEKAAAEKKIQSQRAAEEERIAGLLAAGDISQRQADLELATLETTTAAKMAATNRLAKDEKAAALKSFRTQKSAQKAQATIDAARAGLALIPAYSFLGPGAPVAAAATAAVALAAQIATINAQKPPEFAGGGLVADRAFAGDHVPILASPSEGIVSPRGMAGLGRGGLDAINSGAGMGTSVAVYIDRQIIASTVADALSTDSGVGAALDARAGIRTGQALVYGRG